MAKKAAKKTTKKPAAKKAKPAAKKAVCKPSGVIADVQELVSLMTANDITEVHLEDGDKKILLRRGGTPMMAAPVAAPLAAPAAVAPAAPAAAPAAAEAPADNLIEITSPMVGTFYASPSPDSAPFASVGDKVSAQTVVCIVEAMKVMNEIAADCAGTIAEVCVENAQPVEFGQVLFRVKPN